jgi:hypothetical protein
VKKASVLSYRNNYSIHNQPINQPDLFTSHLDIFLINNGCWRLDHNVGFGVGGVRNHQ